MKTQGKQMVMRPGTGWKHLNGPVWEHETGTRIHVNGLVRLPDMTMVSVNIWPKMIEVSRFVKINGGNKKRGLMAYSLNLVGA